MRAVFADPKTDLVFKRIFGSEARKPLLVALLNHLLELDGDRLIVDVQHLSGEQHVDVAELKLSIVDVKCTDASGRRFVVCSPKPDYLAIITAYIPHPDQWSVDFRTRK